jgi:hypothetical protein
VVDYTASIKRPFSDATKFVLGIIIGIIPIVNILLGGYFLRIAKSAMGKNMMLPEWKDMVNMFVNGILLIIVGIIYMIPVWIIGAIGVFVGLMTLPSILQPANFMENIVPENILAVGLKSNIMEIGTWLLGAGITAFIVFIIAIIFALLASVAILRFAESGDFGSAFSFKSIANKAFTGKFIGGWIVTVIIAIIITSILAWIPIIRLFAPFIVGVFVWTNLAQVYTEA